jgi:hypothetical protein
MPFTENVLGEPCPYHESKPHRLKPVLQNPEVDSNPRWERRAGKEARREETEGASLLNSAPSDSSDDSGQVLTKPPSRRGGTAIGDFGGMSCCTFRSGFRSSSEQPPGYCLLPHLYQDAPTIAPLRATGQIARPGLLANNIRVRSIRNFSQTVCGKTKNVVIPRHAACRGIPLVLGIKQRGIPHFVPNDKQKYFFANCVAIMNFEEAARDDMSSTL